MDKVNGLVVWTARARLQVINEETMMWKTLSNVMDTPNRINEEVVRLKSLGYKNIWINDCFGRRIAD